MSTRPDSVSPANDSNTGKPRETLWRIGFYISVLVPVALAVVMYQLEPLEPASMPTHEWTRPAIVAPSRNNRMLQGSEIIGLNQLLGPEDMVYDTKSKVIYTGCSDGWIKRVTVNESASDTVVQNWVNVGGGRPLGLALGHHENFIVADPDKGLLNVTGIGVGVVEVLTSEADGLPFKLTDGVDVAEDGMIYFTDASHKYGLKDFVWDALEGKPHGRLLSYDPSTKKTQVLVDKLYFPNGVAVSPNQSYLVFCETVMRRCRKYHIQGKKKGSVENFIKNLPGMPDSIHYDGDGNYWVALGAGVNFAWDVAQRYPSVRKILGILVRYIGLPQMDNNCGALVVDLEGNPTAHYYDIGLRLVSSGIKVGDHLYIGSLFNPCIIRLNLAQYPAQAVV